MENQQTPATATEKKTAAVALMDRIDKIKSDAKKILLKQTIKSVEKLDQLIATYSEIEIKDKASYELSVKGSKEMKRIRNLIDTGRKMMTAPIVSIQKDLIAEAKPWTEKLQNAENAINKKTKVFEDIEEAKKNELFADRCKQLADTGFNVIDGNYQCGPLFLSPEQIAKFNESEFELHLSIGKKELERQAADKKRRDDQEARIDKKMEEMRLQSEELKKDNAALTKMLIEAGGEPPVKEKPVEEKPVAKVVGKVSQPEAETNPETPPPKTDAPDFKKNRDVVYSQAGPMGDEPKKLATVARSAKEYQQDIAKATENGFTEFKNRLIVALNDRENKRNLAGWLKWAGEQNIN